jgi:hypothetical protein
MDLARELSALAAHVEWPATPELRLSLEHAPRRRSRRTVFAAVALAVLLAVGVALAVPQSRAAILRFFHLGAVTIQVVDRLPAAQERPLTAGLGPVIGRAEARALIPDVLLPPLTPQPPLHRDGGAAVSLVFELEGEPVLLSEFGYGAGLMKKVVGGAGGAVEWTDVNGATAAWLPGPHDVYLPGTVPPRLAGSVLVWERGAVTYRLEGRSLSRSAALELARSLRHD